MRARYVFLCECATERTVKISTTGKGEMMAVLM